MESLRKVRAQVATAKGKSAKLADSGAVELNRSFTTAPEKTHSLCTILAQISPVRTCRGEGEIYEQQTRLKVVVIKGMAMVPKRLHLSFKAGATTL